MKLLNLGCGSKRPPLPWVNVDTLRQQLSGPALQQLNNEPNYIEADISKELPFDNSVFNGVLLAHVVEHFSVQPAQKLLKEVLRVLKPSGQVLVSVPDAQYFRHTFPQDKGAITWQDLYGVNDLPNPLPNWMTAALYFEQHFQVFSEDTLWCALTQAGFKDVTRAVKPPVFEDTILKEMSTLLDRIPFSLVMTGRKE